MQMAFACECFDALTDQWPNAVGVLFQWDQPPYHTILRPIEEADLRVAQWRNRKALRIFRDCLSSGHWPGPGEDIGAYQRPDWQAAMIERQMEEDTQ